MPEIESCHVCGMSWYTGDTIPCECCWECDSEECCCNDFCDNCDDREENCICCLSCGSYCNKKCCCSCKKEKKEIKHQCGLILCKICLDNLDELLNF